MLAWREHLLRVTCLAVGASQLITALVFMLFVGDAFGDHGLAVGLGLASLALPWLPRVSTRMRALILVVLGAVALAMRGAHAGWVPGNVALSCLLLTAAGLLLDRRVGYALLAMQGLALWAGAGLVERGVLRIDQRALAPEVFVHWVRVALIFGAFGCALWTILRVVTQHVTGNYEQASRDLGLAEAQLAASRQRRSARLSAERSLRDQQKVQAVGQLAGGLAHLINNELTVIAGALDELRRDHGIAVRRQVAKQIEDSVARASFTIRRLLVFSRRDEARDAPLDLRSEVAKAVEELKPTIGSDLAIAVQGAEGAIVAFDPNRLRLLVVNLLLNAVDALPKGGEVRLSIVPNQAERRVTLTVEDAGTGMDTETLARATDSFFTTKSQAKHAGLGLSVAAGIVDQAGGVLTVESLLGVGTRVQVHLPASALPEASWQGALLHPSPMMPPATPTVAEAVAPLTVDADAWKREMLVQLSRAAALMLASAVIVNRVFNPDAPRISQVVIGGAALGTGIAGWARGWSHDTRFAALLAALFMGCTGVLLHFTFLTPGLICTMLMLVAWATMLGREWLGPLVLAYFVSSLIVVGALHGGGVVHGLLSMTTMESPANWRRVAVNSSVIELVLLASMWWIVDHAAAGTRTMTQARQQLQRARRQEDEEAARAIELERQSARMERISVSGAVAGGIAHDLNNMLQGLGLASVLTDETLSEADIADIAEHLQRCATYCHAIVQLVGEDVPAGETDTPLDLAEAVERVMRLLPILVGRDVRVTCDLTPGVRVALHEAKLQRIVLNLAANARDAMEGRGTLTIGVRSVQDRAVLSVADSGEGMDAATRARVFEPFFTTKPAGKGTGLGLHAVARIVADSGGTVSCESEPGAGATFVLSWPLCNVDAPRVDDASPGANAIRRGRVLVAEDEVSVRRVLVRSLTLAGFDVGEASDGDAAMALVEGDDAWIALCIDGVMPGRPTAQVIDAFVAKHPGCPVLLCSGHLPETLALRGIQQAAVTFLPKPFTPRDLQETLNRALAARRL